MRRNILLINHYAGSPYHGMEYRPYYLAREWVRQGHQVTVAAASFSHVRQQQPVFRGSYYEELVDGIRYVWLKTPSYQGNGWRRAANMFSFIAQLYRRRTLLIGGTKLDAVIASSTYPLDIYPASRIARRENACLVFEVHDLWPLSPIELGGMSPRHPFIRLIQQAEDFAYRRADLVVSLLPLAKSYMVQRGMRPDKFVHLPNGIDVAGCERNEPLPADLVKTLKRLRNDHPFVVGYSGSFGLANSLENLVEAAAMLHNDRVAFALVGQGPEKQRLQQRIAGLDLKNIAVLPPIPKSSVPAFLAEVDAAYIGWKPCSLYRFGVSPNKLFDYMMAAKPIVQAIAAGNDLVAETQCGLSVAPENPAELAAAVTKLMSLPRNELHAMGQNGRRYAEQNHDYAKLAAQFIRLIERSKNQTTPTPAAQRAIGSQPKQYAEREKSGQAA